MQSPNITNAPGKTHKDHPYINLYPPQYSIIEKLYIKHVTESPKSCVLVTMAHGDKKEHKS